MTNNVVVTGVGCISSLGNNMEATWNSIIQGKTGVGRADRVKIDPEYPSSLACTIKFDTGYNEGGLVNDPSIIELLQSIQQMKKDYDAPDEILHSCGIVVGTTAAGMSTYERFHERYNKNNRRICGINDLYEGMVGSLLSCAMEQAIIMYNMTGPSSTIETACASSAIACVNAYDMIRLGNADVMIAAGVDMLCNATYSGFSSLRLMEDDVYRPFDINRKGLVLGEAASVMLLESEEHAKQRGARIIARLSGCGMSCDAYDMTAPDTEGGEAALSMCKALKEAKLNPEEIDYINAHGTGTNLNDIMETTAIKRAFGDAHRNIKVSSTKSMTGHTLGAAGLLEAVFSVLCIRDNILPPTANLETPDGNCSLNHIINNALKRDVKAVMTNSLGFGGINVSLVFTR